MIAEADGRAEAYAFAADAGHVAFRRREHDAHPSDIRTARLGERLFRRHQRGSQRQIAFGDLDAVERACGELAADRGFGAERGGPAPTAERGLASEHALAELGHAAPEASDRAAAGQEDGAAHCVSPTLMRVSLLVVIVSR